MPDPTKNKPEANLPAASPQPGRSKVAEIQHLRPGVRPERRYTDAKSRSAEIASREAATLETATRIAAEFIAQESLEKAKLAAEAHRAKLDLTREKDERQAAAIEAEARLAAVHQDLADIHESAAATRKSLARERTIRVVALLAATVLIGAALIYRSTPGIPALPVPPLTPRSPPGTTKLVPESQAALNNPEVRFAEGMDRLNYTLATTADGKPQDAIHKVRNTAGPAVCPFVWRNGQVTLTFNEETNLFSLGKMLARCAEAVAQLP